VIRPLLDVSRAEIEAFLAERSLPFRTDRSNLETDFDRNKIRLELLPHAERLLGRPVRGPIARAAEILAETEAYLAAEGARWIRENARTAGEATDLCAGALAALPRALGREVVRAMVRGGPDPSASIGSERVERVLRLARRAAGGRVLLPGGREARREGERIRFAPREETLPPFLAPLDVPGETLLPDGRRVVARLLDAREAGDDAPASRQRARLDHDRVRPPLVVRSRLPGDRLRPLGSPGERKLQDLLVDRKIPRSERDTIPLMADEDGILWVAGVEIAERAKIAASTRVILEVALFPPRYDTEGAGEGLPRGEAPGHGTFV
jgi:tRNA(Ile)-lysidine synthase